MATPTTINTLVSPVVLFLILLSAPADYSNASAETAEAVGGDTGPCFTSLFSFGDSVSDTGNQMLLGKCPHCCSLPNGETYFGRPTGRCCNGRLIVDFIAEKLGLPLLTPFPGELKSSNFRFGANLAEGGATALDFRFLAERGIFNTHTNVSLGDELKRFRNLLPTLCSSPSGIYHHFNKWLFAECKIYLGKSLIIMGEIGGIDYNRAYFENVAVEQITELVPYVIAEIGNAIQEMVELGAVTILVPGNFPLGCHAGYLAKFWSPNKEDYDPLTGCLVQFNNFAQHHNDLLQEEVVRLQKVHPHANIMYADYYNSVMRLHLHPDEFGFSASLVACCGGGGPYNYNESLLCGVPGTTACADPSTFINWDDHHLTEAAYRIIANDVLQGPFSIPRFNTSHCPVTTRAASGEGHYFAY
ncbi:unnamed protein product [Linum tenue]|uniref:Uncharacterized protein n=1 Tax=Linum tenue TaxID=586396 RepID=A0AAV0MFI8_9ROSI|nr:unnamed protein product [Linum tenue]